MFSLVCSFQNDFAGLDYAQAVSAVIHQWSTGIIKSDFYTKWQGLKKRLRRWAEVAASETLEEMSPQPHQ